MIDLGNIAGDVMSKYEKTKRESIAAATTPEEKAKIAAFFQELDSDIGNRDVDIVKKMGHFLSKARILFGNR